MEATLHIIGDVFLAFVMITMWGLFFVGTVISIAKKVKKERSSSVVSGQRANYSLNDNPVSLASSK